MSMHHPGASSMMFYNSPPQRHSSVSATSNRSGTATPLEEKSQSDAFDFQVPSLPPRLANFGRKISQMRDDFMDNLDGTSAPSSRRTSMDVRQHSNGSSRRQSMDNVPGMGDEPVMCPFCNKPLPPSLFTIHGHNHTSNQSSNSNNTPSTGLARSSTQKSFGSRPKMGSRPATSMGIQRSETSTPTPLKSRTVNLDSPTTTTTTQGVNPITPVSATKKLMEPLPVRSPTYLALMAAQQAGQPTPHVPADPSITSDTLLPLVKEGDTANHDAAVLMISDDDLKRWSALAGMSPPKTSTLERSVSAPPTSPTAEKQVPKLDPPPPPSNLAANSAEPTPRPPVLEERKSSGSTRFNFFRKTSDKNANADTGDSESEGEEGGTGYAKLLGAGSDTEDEATDVLHEEPGDMHAQPSKSEDKEEVANAEPAAEPKTANVEDKTEEVQSEEPLSAVPVMESAPIDNTQLQTVLREIIGKMGEISRSHSALLTSQSSLLTALKIARSNLAMAEANTEMLEDQLKQTKSRVPSGATPRTPNTPKSAMTSTATSTTSNPATATSDAPRAKPIDAPRSASMAQVPTRGSLERSRPTSLQMPPPSVPGSAPAFESDKSGWGFWNGGKKRLTSRLESMNLPSPSDVLQSVTTPTGERSSFDFSVLGSSAAPYSGALPERRSTEFSRSPTVDKQNLISGGGSAMAGEVAKLRLAYNTAQNRMESMSKELAELKKGKVEMEAELENLSQALFEEANNMVADERRKRAEAEESLKEVKAEREALRSTIKVLGGTGDDKASDISSQNGDVAKVEDLEEADFHPRDLDKHYEALRKSIHHVADGAIPTSPNSPKSPITPFAKFDLAVSGASPPNATKRGYENTGDLADQDEIRLSEQEGAGHTSDIRAIAKNPEVESSFDVPESIPEQPEHFGQSEQSEKSGQSPRRSDSMSSSNSLPFSMSSLGAGDREEEGTGGEKKGLMPPSEDNPWANDKTPTDSPKRNTLSLNDEAAA